MVTCLNNTSVLVSFPSEFRTFVHALCIDHFNNSNITVVFLSVYVDKRGQSGGPSLETTLAFD